MDYIAQLMATGEKVVFVTRRHWLALLPAILIDLAVVIVIVALSVGGAFLNPLSLFVLLLLIVPIAHFLIVWIRYSNEQYVVTNRRVMEVKGVFKKHTSDSSLEKVNDVVMEQSALGRLLDFGDVRIITGSDVGVNAFRRIAHPIRFKIAMLDEKGRLERPELGKGGAVTPDQVPAMLAQLDDLRQRNVITQEEFEREKQQLLERLK